MKEKIKKYIKSLINKIKKEINKIKISIKKYFKSKEKLIKEICQLQIKNQKLQDYKEISDRLAIDKIKLNTFVEIKKSEIRKLKLELKKYEKKNS